MLSMCAVKVGLSPCNTVCHAIENREMQSRKHMRRAYCVVQKTETMQLVN